MVSAPLLYAVITIHLSLISFRETAHLLSTQSIINESQSIEQRLF